ncbi:MAG: hypothetical protein NTV05_08435 [Acidobacteria bacterium]|nr:hypothetical protein [Acidobacteriota bacterium]
MGALDPSDLTVPQGGLQNSAHMPIKHSTYRKAASLLLAGFVAMTLGCEQTAVVKDVEGYRVVSHDTKTGEWVILRNGTFDGKYLVKRITAVCNYYQWGNGKRVEGQDACNLRVGEMLVPTVAPDRGKESLVISELSSEWLTIIRGQGPEMVIQTLKIVKYEVLP